MDPLPEPTGAALRGVSPTSGMLGLAALAAVAVNAVDPGAPSAPVGPAACVGAHDVVPTTVTLVPVGVRVKVCAGAPP
ncbi:MAG TPA: hypothetical protein VND62_05720 [Acidimicrobiales bacterium]|nr:hypothetical protein [Acidimicrobiales bacterium]